MFPRLFLTSCASAALAGCMTAATPPGETPEPVERLPGEDSPCRSQPAQAFVGKMATAELGAQVHAETGARIFQWVPPDSAVTMDYRPDRVRVSYDRAMIVTNIRCG
ncbi:I78 family peptidase inhibitor [Erythrobacter litoralis]|nr:I78 family peptidase inhibitor [Erythrobacter litoralis]